MTDSALSRRRFLVYSGAGVAGLATSSALGPLAQADTFFSTDTPVTLARAIAASRGLGQRAATCPIPLLRDGVDAADEATEFATFTVEDDFVLARGLEYYVIIEWGESVAGSRFGYNADYTSLVRVINPFQKGDLLLTVNHEYVSGIPWQQTFHEVTGIALPSVQLDASNKLVVLGTQLASNSVDIDDPTLTSLQRAAIVEFCPAGDDRSGRVSRSAQTRCVRQALPRGRSGRGASDHWNLGPRQSVRASDVRRAGGFRLHALQRRSARQRSHRDLWQLQRSDDAVGNGAHVRRELPVRRTRGRAAKRESFPQLNREIRARGAKCCDGTGRPDQRHRQSFQVAGEQIRMVRRDRSGAADIAPIQADCAWPVPARKCCVPC
ncbi:MAG: DUF839 domain-containing protein [Blastocatellia bacterium]|nr:DUF839 domain-containing protein [Blastocatellia bacterium]